MKLPLNHNWSITCYKCGNKMAIKEQCELAIDLAERLETYKKALEGLVISVDDAFPQEFMTTPYEQLPDGLIDCLKIAKEALTQEGKRKEEQK